MNPLVLTEENRIVSEKWVTDIVVACGSPDNTWFTSPSETGIFERLWDLASVTKLYSIVSILSLHENKLFDITKRVKDYSNDYPYLSEKRIFELLNFSVELRTASRIDLCESYDNAIEFLHSIQILSNNTTYSDMGIMVVVQLINEINKSEYFFRDYTYELLKHANIHNTVWWKDIKPSMSNIENYDSEFRYIDGKLNEYKTPVGICHDSKARVIPYTGHSGLFSNAKDVATFANALLSGKIISRDTLEIITASKYDVWDDTHHYGLLCNKKHPNKEFSEIPAICSNNSIAISGYTGTYLLFDFERHHFIFIGANRLHNRISNLTHDSKMFDMPCTKDYVFRKDVLVDLIASELNSIEE